VGPENRSRARGPTAAGHRPARPDREQEGRRKTSGPGRRRAPGKRAASVSRVTTGTTGAIGYAASTHWIVGASSGNLAHMCCKNWLRLRPGRTFLKVEILIRLTRGSVSASALSMRVPWRHRLVRLNALTAQHLVGGRLEPLSAIDSNRLLSGVPHSPRLWASARNRCRSRAAVLSAGSVLSCANIASTMDGIFRPTAARYSQDNFGSTFASLGRLPKLLPRNRHSDFSAHAG
jgi:hypothetical protein